MRGPRRPTSTAAIGPLQARTWLALALAAAILVAGCEAAAAPSRGGRSDAGRTLTAGTPVHPSGPTEPATLVRVVDGDTIRVILGGVEERVRYIGTDTPELNIDSKATPEAYAQAATEANRRLLEGGTLLLEKDVSERDRYGRLLRNVWVERDGTWTLVGLELVAQGYAQVATFPPDVKYVDALLEAERAAREAGRGLWSAP